MDPDKSVRTAGNFGSYNAAFRSQSRLASLYSDFRSQRSTNPDGYWANCAAWLDVLTAAANDGILQTTNADRFILQTGESLLRSLALPQYGQPLALGAVLEYALDQHEVVPLQEYLSARTSIHNKSRLPSAWQAINWGLVGLGLVSRKDGEEHWKSSKLVVIKNLEEAAEHITQQAEKVISSHATSVFSKDQFVQTFIASKATYRDGKITPDDLKVLLTYLSRDRPVIAYDNVSGTVKFPSGSETSPSAMTSEDIDTASLRSLIATLEKQVSQLNTRIAECDQHVRTAIVAKNTLSAKNALRSKKLAESTLQQRLSTLHQMEDVFTKIEQAADQVEVVRVMQSSGRTLRILNERTGGIDKVHEIMDDLHEEAQKTDEIGQAISSDDRNVIDEAEVDDEIEALEQAERAKKIAAEQRQKDAEDEREAEATREKLAALESPTKAAFRQFDDEAERAAQESAT